MTKRTGRLPKQVLVGPHHYKLVCDADAIAKASHRDGSALYGSTDKVKLVIVVDPAQARSQLADTVLHESLHCLLALVGADMELEQEERLVRSLSPALLDWLRRNPKLIDWLTEEDKRGND